MVFLAFSLLLGDRRQRKITAGTSSLNFPVMENTLLNKRVDHIVPAAMAEFLQIFIIDPTRRTLLNDLRFFFTKLITTERAGIHLAYQGEPIILLNDLNRRLLTAGRTENLFRP